MMQFDQFVWNDPMEAAMRLDPDEPIACFCPDALRAQYERFRSGFDGLVTYAVKANASRVVLDNLSALGMRAFDVASPAEMRAVREACPEAVLHYHNPVRSRAEIAQARALEVNVWSVDNAHELDKVAPGSGDEISVRLALPVTGAAYDFGEKFGADKARCAALLRAVERLGARPSITFHPGTQCADPGCWEEYIRAAADVAERAGVRLYRLNVGGGFAADRDGRPVALDRILRHIGSVVQDVFATPPHLVCEPGRALVGEAFTLVTRIKSIRHDGAVYLNDGLYGGLGELRDMTVPARRDLRAPDGRRRRGPLRPRTVFGPTCDSVDRLPGDVMLPDTCEEGDFLFFPAMGAYSLSLNTGFNGYGIGKIATVRSGLSRSGQC